LTSDKYFEANRLKWYVQSNFKGYTVGAYTIVAPEARKRKYLMYTCELKAA